MATYFYSQARPNGLLPKGNIQNLKVLSLLVQRKQKQKKAPVLLLFLSLVLIFALNLELVASLLKQDKLSTKIHGHTQGKSNGVG